MSRLHYIHYSQCDTVSDPPLVVLRVLRVGKIKYHRRVRLSPTTISELTLEVDGAVEAERAIRVNIDVEGLEVGWSIDDTNIAGLDEVVGDDEVLLVRSYLDVVRANGRLVLVGVIKTLDVVQVRDIKGSNVVGGGQSNCFVSIRCTWPRNCLQYANLPSWLMSE